MGSTQPTIRVVHADDHTFLRDGVAFSLANVADLELVAQGKDGVEAVALAEKHRPDVVLLDLSMPNLDGLAAATRIKKVSLDIKVIILSIHEEKPYALRALEAGADGYMHKGASEEEVYRAIRRAHAGKRVMPKHLKELEDLKIKIGKPFEVWDLSKREQQVFYILADCRTSHDAAKELGINVKTIDSHRGHILRKLGLRNNADLTRFAIKHNLMDP